MDQIAIGKFISECRKEKHLTQAQLAERLGVTDRAVSKWETGRSLPDASIMLELCEQIGVTVNDLFNARRIDMENYKEIAEKTMLEIREREEQTAKKLLSYEVLIGILCMIVFLVLMGVAALTDMKAEIKAVLIATGILTIIAYSFIALKIETEAGYYQCPNCGKRYVPAYKSVFFAPHINRTRHMRCPHCDQKGWHRKVLTKKSKGDIIMLEELKEYLPFLIPLVILQLTLMITALVSVFKHQRYKVGNRVLWVIVCAVISIIGPVLYFAIGKEES